MLDCGESGLSIRMFTPIAALSKDELTVTGRGSLLTRPMNLFDEIFPLLKVRFSSNNGKLPLQLIGPLQPSNITIDGSLSSQFLTGLLMAYSASVETLVAITVTNLKSKPYIQLTLDVLKAFNLLVPENQDFKKFVFQNNPIDAAKNNHINFTVESDWSSASFLLVAGVIAGGILVEGLNEKSLQADIRILEALRETGAIITFEGDVCSVARGLLLPFSFDATDCPDLFPPLVALASYCKGTSIIKGVHRLQHKESDRGKALQEEFAKLGIVIKVENDSMIIEGTGVIKSATVHSHHDHRIAMACAVAALKAEGKVVIESAEAIDKSYPAFLKILKS
jgi:3-phosphoshikimate 1-carboxyvinyltransferase